MLANSVREGVAKHTAWCELSEKFHADLVHDSSALKIECSQKRAMKRLKSIKIFLVTGMNSIYLIKTVINPLLIFAHFDI